MIEVKNLCKNYGDRAAISHLNFTIEKGDVVGLLGPNGAGKSTTMKIITGFMAPTSGEALVSGFDVFEHPIEVKKRIGYLPETPPVYLDMTVVDYLNFVADLKMVDPKKKKDYIQNSLLKTQTESVQNRLIRNLSKGFKQRVGLAQALVSNPEILILDEPTVGLDPKQVAEVRQLIKDLRGQHTIILSTHILSEVQATCNKVIIIHQGQIVAQDSIENIEKLSEQKIQISLRTRKPILDSSIFKNQVVDLEMTTMDDGSYKLIFKNDEALIDQVAKIVIEKNYGLLELKITKKSLEDVFLNLTYGVKN